MLKVMTRGILGVAGVKTRKATVYLPVALPCRCNCRDQPPQPSAITIIAHVFVFVKQNSRYCLGNGRPGEESNPNHTV